MERFYNNKRVQVRDTFRLGGETYARIYLGNGKTEVVKFEELSESMSEIVYSPDKLVSVVENVDGDVSAIITDKDKIVIANKEIVLDGKTALVDGSVVENLVFKDDVKETKVKEELKPEEIVAIKQSNNRKTKLGLRSELTKSPAVKRLKLNPESIESVLDGKQKTHKGYKFEVVK